MNNDCGSKVTSPAAAGGLVSFPDPQAWRAHVRVWERDYGGTGLDACAYIEFECVIHVHDIVHTSHTKSSTQAQGHAQSLFTAGVLSLEHVPQHLEALTVSLLCGQ